MSLTISTTNWKKFLEHEKKLHGISSIGILNLNDELQNEISAKITAKDQALLKNALPKYVKDTIDLRSDPRKLFPWAKSIIIVAIPFNIIPEIDNFLPEATNPLFAGKISAYATRQDYHIFAKELFCSIAQNLSDFFNIHTNEKQLIKSEICVDTMPVAERALALAGNLGEIGRNTSLLTSDAGSGCFIAELFTDIDAPTIKPATFSVSCASCCNCINACDTGALESQSDFAYALCRSCLTMEKRGMLSLAERNSLGGWIFGCDDCSSCCPKTKLPAPFQADLAWLLTIDTAEVKKKIKGTAIEYAGVTLLRRNALAVLGNHKNKETVDLIKNFAKKTGSRLLRTTAEEILDNT